MKNGHDRATGFCVATSTLELYAGTVSIRCYLPKKLGTEVYGCHYEFDGAIEQLGCEFGKDSMQAFLRALSKITGVLSYSSKRSDLEKWRYEFKPILTQTEYLRIESNHKLFCGLHGIPRKQSEFVRNDYWRVEAKRVKSKTRARREGKPLRVMASREFNFRGSPITVNMAVPKKSLTKLPGLTCRYEILGLAQPITRETYGSSSFQAMHLAYYALWLDLTAVKTDLHWSLGGPGQHGLPVPYSLSNKTMQEVETMYQSILSQENGRSLR